MAANDRTIYEVLEEEHEQVSALLEELEALAGDDTDKKRELFDELRHELLAHAEAESETFYAELERHDASRDDALEGTAEHQVVRRLLADLGQMTEMDERWDAKLQVLKENVEHHVEEEEGEMFSSAREVLDDDEARDLAKRFLERKHASQRK